MRRFVASCLCALTACGRLGFDQTVAGDAATTDVSAVDAALGPWSPPTPVNVPDVGLFDDPSLTSDLLELYFNRGGNEVMTATRAAVGQPWSTPIVVGLLSTPGASAVPEVAADGLTIYFMSTRSGSSLGDIWVSTRALRSDPWTEPVVVSPLNGPGNDLGGSTTADTELLVMRSDASGNPDLFTSMRPSAQAAWSAPQPIPGFSSIEVEDEPFMSLDGLRLYYTGPGLDLYVSERASRLDPFPAGTPIVELSSASADHDPWVSADGRYIMFASDRSGQLELWEATR